MMLSCDYVPKEDAIEYCIENHEEAMIDAVREHYRKEIISDLVTYNRDEVVKALNQTKTLKYRIWYKKTLKQTGMPICVQDVATGLITFTNEFKLEGCEIRIAFENSHGASKACGATTILEVYV
jgi:NAD(P)H-nitrite reductase large subunit